MFVFSLFHYAVQKSRKTYKIHISIRAIFLLFIYIYLNGIPPQFSSSHSPLPHHSLSHLCGSNSLPPTASYSSRCAVNLACCHSSQKVLDLRLLNRMLSKCSFKMITVWQILSHIRPGDWFISVDLKLAYFHIQVAPRHRRFLIFAFEGIAYQFTVLPFGLMSYSELRADCKYAKEHAGTEPEHLLFRSGAELNQYARASVGGALTKTDQLS